MGCPPHPLSSQGSPRTCGFFLGRPLPLFSDTSFSPLEARGWLDLALDSLIVLPAAVRRSRRGEEGQSVMAYHADQCLSPHPLPQRRWALGATELTHGAARDKRSCRSLPQSQPGHGHAPAPAARSPPPPGKDAQPPQLPPGPSAGMGVAGGVSAWPGGDKDQGLPSKNAS